MDLKESWVQEVCVHSGCMNRANFQKILFHRNDSLFEQEQHVGGKSSNSRMILKRLPSESGSCYLLSRTILCLAENLVMLAGRKLMIQAVINILPEASLKL